MVCFSLGVGVHYCWAKIAFFSIIIYVYKIFLAFCLGVLFTRLSLD